MEEKSKEE